MSTLRYAFRSLLKSPGFTLLIGVILAVGMAGTIVMAALIQGVLLRPLPVREQDRLIVAWKELRSSGYAHYPFGDIEVDAIARDSHLFESVAGVGSNGVSRVAVVDNDATGYVNDALVTGGLFEVLGVQPILGRTLTRADDLEGAERVVVISHALWQRRYGGARDVIGRRIFPDNSIAIVGVMPPDFDYPRGVDVWRSTHTIDGKFNDAARREVDLVGRLRPGVTLEQAASELAALTRQFEAGALATQPRGLIPVVRRFEDEVIGDVRPAMVALFGAVAFVLLIASANAANLLLMRNETRRTELAVRVALGAGRGRIAAQALVESTLLAIAAATAGFALTWWGLQALVRLVPDGLPRIESVRIDAGIAMFTMAIARATAAITGLVPALTLGGDLISLLKSTGRASAGSASQWVRRAFVVTQVALAVTVIATAGLLARTVLRLQSVDTGIAADRLVFVELSLPAAEHADRVRHTQFLDTVTAELEAVPSIAAATPINVPPFSNILWDVPRFTAEGQSPERAATNPALNFESVFPNYFRALEIALVRGRAFTDSDRQGAPAVAIVSEDVAARTWPGENPIGKRLKLGGFTSRDNWLTVVGVAAPTRFRELTRARPMLYLPAAQFLVTGNILALRTTAPLDQVLTVSRARVRAANPRAHIVRVASFNEMLQVPLARPRFNALLLNIFGVLALSLATIGLYAVIGMYVRQRDRDIAVRRALGATAADVSRLVLGEAIWLAALGAAIGLIGAVGAAQLVRGMLFDVDPLDPLTILGAAMLLVGVSVLASYLPVRRATRIDPLVALRYE
jgi:putative ABC transport system permease protein